MATKKKKAQEPKLNTYRAGPDDQGFFGLFGGRFVAETLMPLILELGKAYADAKADPAYQRELDALPARIEALELEQKDLGALLASAELYAEDPVRAEAAQMRYAQIDDELLAALERWEALGAS